MGKSQTMPWNERQEVQWLQYTVQPPLGLLRENYYHAQGRFGESEWSKGHLGELMVVIDDKWRIVYTEFNETTMEGYYNRYFGDVSKRRSDYGIWQTPVRRQASAGVVLVNGMLHVEQQILERQFLEGEFDLLTGASNSMRGLLPLAKELAGETKTPSTKRYYSAAGDSGYGITGWLQVVMEGERIPSCLYDEVFADPQDGINYPELRHYYRQSKYYSPCFEEPEIPGWKSHGFSIGFHKLMNILNGRVMASRDLMAIDGPKHVDGYHAGLVWDRHSLEDRPSTMEKTNLRYPIWDNYLKLAEMVKEEIEADKEERKRRVL